jgi:hypothetical protein
MGISQHEAEGNIEWQVDGGIRRRDYASARPLKPDWNAGQLLDVSYDSPDVGKVLETSSKGRIEH